MIWRAPGTRRDNVPDNDRAIATRWWDCALAADASGDFEAKAWSVVTCPFCVTRSGKTSK